MEWIIRCQVLYFLVLKTTLFSLHIFCFLFLFILHASPLNPETLPSPSVLEIEPRTLQRLNKHSATRPHLHSPLPFNKESVVSHSRNLSACLSTPYSSTCLLWAYFSAEKSPVQKYNKQPNWKVKHLSVHCNLWLPMGHSPDCLLLTVDIHYEWVTLYVRFCYVPMKNDFSPSRHLATTLWLSLSPWQWRDSNPCSGLLSTGLSRNCSFAVKDMGRFSVCVLNPMLL